MFKVTNMDREIITTFINFNKETKENNSKTKQGGNAKSVSWLIKHFEENSQNIEYKKLPLDGV